MLLKSLILTLCCEELKIFGNILVDRFRFEFEISISKAEKLKNYKKNNFWNFYKKKDLRFI